MKGIRVWVLAAGLLISASALCAEEALNQGLENTTTTNSVGVDKLWAGMHGVGMIDAAQYQHVLEHGRLPGGTSVTNSPVPVEEQAGWSRLAEHEVNTPAELAHLLFNGTVPGMDEEEQKAFSKLAPFYQPSRAKRLGYELRRKHQKVELIRLQHRMHEEYTARRAETEIRAKELGIPLKLELSGGGFIKLDYFDELGHPQFIQADNAIAAATISTDQLWPAVTNGLSLTGSGVTLGIWEAGGAVRRTHQEFGSRVHQRDDASSYADHATAVAATMIASGAYSESARGMSYAASLDAYDYDDDLAEMDEAARLGPVIIPAPIIGLGGD